LLEQDRGKRVGYRTLILYHATERAFFVYGFAKNNQENIGDDETAALRALAKNVLNLSDEILKGLLKQGVYTEVTQHDEQNL
jgi:hypothetical protein